MYEALKTPDQTELLGPIAAHQKIIGNLAVEAAQKANLPPPDLQPEVPLKKTQELVERALLGFMTQPYMSYRDVTTQDICSELDMTSNEWQNARSMLLDKNLLIVAPQEREIRRKKLIGLNSYGVVDSVDEPFMTLPVLTALRSNLMESDNRSAIARLDINESEHLIPSALETDFEAILRYIFCWQLKPWTL